MKHWEIVDPTTDEEIRIEWNESETFNLQTTIAGQWVDYYCFTCNSIDNEQDALELALQVIEDENRKYQSEGW